MTNYDSGRRPTRPGVGFGAGWIIFVIVNLVIIGFGWDARYRGWYGGGGHVANAPESAPANSAANANAAHNANANANATPAPAKNKP